MVKKTIALTMTDDYWVEAELSEVREVHGHCFLELIQKDSHNNTPVAKASAKIWASRWVLLRSLFKRITGEYLKPGMKVLICVTPNFHEAYGFSWIVNDIDPTYTIGDMARQRQEIIDELKKSGIFSMNKELTIPMFAQRIAVISSETAAGYEDFCNQLHHNAYGFTFLVHLFPAIMQGESVEKSIIGALNNIYKEVNAFDVVVIIRGGGANSDLSGFDALDLAENVAQFPLPIITGIGHERDDTILDLISNTRVKTPTAAAEFLVSRLNDVSEHINDMQTQIISNITTQLDYERLRLNKYSTIIPSLFSVVKSKKESHLNLLLQRIKDASLMTLKQKDYHISSLSIKLQPAINKILMTEKHRIELLQQRTEATNPKRLLSRGYSITLLNGKSVRDPKVLKHGDEIETTIEKGKVKSIIK